MTEPSPGTARPDEDPDLFRAEVNYTSAEAAFAARLIEKDYFCTLLLKHLAGSGDTLVFRGGTCLVKVHAGFYRLSEDLDFVLRVRTDAPRAERSARAVRVREAAAALTGNLPVFRAAQLLTGANRSTQCVAIRDFYDIDCYSQTGHRSSGWRIGRIGPLHTGRTRQRTSGCL